MQNWDKQILSTKTSDDFNNLCVKAFDYQYKNIKIYADYCNKINTKPNRVKHYTDIPFLPIDFFKTNKIIAKNKKAQTTFISSGTTQTQRSKHFVANLDLYEKSFRKTFELFYGNFTDYCILALLPNYLEQGKSSLIYMANDLIKLSKHPKSGFYLHNYNELFETLNELNNTNQKVILLGVSYALLDFTEQFEMDLKNTIIMETGGMKGRRKELTRHELHNKIGSALNVKNIHSEYGMSELLSQAYSFGNGIFRTPPHMKIIIRDTYDPFTMEKNGKTGGINVIDLANIYSCCFIETKDLGKTFDNGTFSILGRFDNSDIRGCNLMALE